MAHISPFDWASLLDQEPVLPVYNPAADAPAQWGNDARQLQQAGYTVLEVTLRHPHAWAVLDHLKDQGLTLIAGSLRQTTQLTRLRQAGIRFAVSPGWCAELAHQAQDQGIQLLPGIATPSEALQAYHAGYRCVKLFPAQALGGPAYLQALQAPLPELRFVPTGGIQTATLSAWFALPSVIAVGGGWLFHHTTPSTWPNTLQQIREQAWQYRQQHKSHS